MDERLLTILTEIINQDFPEEQSSSLAFRIIRILVSHDEKRSIGNTRKLALLLTSYQLPAIDSHDGFKFNLQILRTKRRVEMLSPTDIVVALEFVLQECDGRLTPSLREDLASILSLLPDLSSFIRVFEQVGVSHPRIAFELLAISVKQLKLSVDSLGWCIEKFSRIVIECKDSGDLDMVVVGGQAFLSGILEFVIPFYSSEFKSKAQFIIAQIKILQSATRSIQMICGSIKEGLAKDQVKQNSTKLFKAVASMKHLLESLVAGIKQLLQQNDCAAAFWLGNLKNKGLEGEEIAASQIALSHSS